jgi:glucose dehydrogenase
MRHNRMTENENTRVASQRQSGDTGVRARPSRRGFLAGAASAAGVAALAGGGYAWHLKHKPDSNADLPEYRGPSARLSDLDNSAPVDVCIVGSGPAGCVLGTELARAGVRTLIVEAGVNPSAMSPNSGYSQLNVATQSGDMPYPLTATRAMLPGGTTSLWTGNTPRLLPLDFEHNAFTPPGAGWPITYREIDPFYELAEQTLQVIGESNVRYAPKRRRALPPTIGSNRLTKDLLASIDIASYDTFRSRTKFGGPVRVARDLLPVFSRESTAIFLPGVIARRFIADDSTQIGNVLLEDLDGGQKFLPARVFVLAAGGVESARRLLLSRSAHFPHGIGNHHDQVGRAFNDHFYVNFTGHVRYPEARPEQLPQGVRSYQFYEAFKHAGLGSMVLSAALHATEARPTVELRMTAGCEVLPDPSNRVTLDETSLDIVGDPVAHLHFGAHERDQATQNAARTVVQSLFHHLDATNVQQFPPHWGHHHMGTLRMGRNERTSVVDASLRVHGVSNLYAITSGTFVTAGPSSPTLLIVALAHRLAQHLLRELRVGAYLTHANG